MTNKEISSIDKTLAHADILLLATYRMPFGKHAGQLLIDLPEPYVVWFHNKGFPNGELGRMLGITYEIKVNGLETLFKPLMKPASNIKK
ncbi:MAG: DUF3820 family protein [Gammaproteobacteria bacterium]|nr:DUF3820 family protein [Gammaproteobacteria bacterium]